MINMKKPLIGIIMGSSSDSRIMHSAAEILDEFGVSHEDQIISAHRTPTRLDEYAKHAEKSGFKVIIAGAGGAAHLPGMIASHTVLPVIGVPILVYNDKQQKNLSINSPRLVVLIPYCQSRKCHLALRWLLLA